MIALVGDGPVVFDGALVNQRALDGQGGSGIDPDRLARENQQGLPAGDGEIAIQGEVARHRDSVVGSEGGGDAACIRDLVIQAVHGDGRILCDVRRAGDPAGFALRDGEVGQGGSAAVNGDVVLFRHHISVGRRQGQVHIRAAGGIALHGIGAVAVSLDMGIRARRQGEVRAGT